MSTLVKMVFKVFFGLFNKSRFILFPSKKKIKISKISLANFSHLDYASGHNIY